MKKIFKITSIVLIQAFLVMDFAMAGKIACSNLSPEVQLGVGQFQNIYSSVYEVEKLKLIKKQPRSALNGYYLDDIAQNLSIRLGRAVKDYGTLTRLNMDNFKDFKKFVKEQVGKIEEIEGFDEDIDKGRFNLSNIYKEGKSICLPYKRVDGKLQILRFYREEDYIDKNEHILYKPKSAVTQMISLHVSMVIEGEDKIKSSIPKRDVFMDIFKKSEDENSEVSGKAKEKLWEVVSAEIARRKTISGKLKLEKPKPITRNAKVRITDFEEVEQGYEILDALVEANRCMNCMQPTCQHGKKERGAKGVGGCPVALNIRDFVVAFREGEIKKSNSIIEENNYLAEITARVCPQENQCQMHCKLGVKGKPLAIGLMERIVKDLSLELYGQTPVEKAHIPENKDYPIAIIGSGPAGLTAAMHLAKKGYTRIYIFEAFHVPGGVLAYGIPPNRLPREITQRQIQKAKDLGVKIITDVVIGKTLSVDDLGEMGFRAFFVGTGAGRPTFMGIEGEELNGVVSANEFLTRVNLMHAGAPGYDTPINVGKRVIVIGGSNVAMDAARTALRKGAEKVFIVYRRGNLPARADEVEHAKEEGIEFLTNSLPLRIIGDDNGKVREVECIKTRIDKVKVGGDKIREQVLNIKGSNFVLGDIDTVIEAIGSKTNTMIVDQTEGLELSSRHTVALVDEEAGQTTRPDTVAAGDAASGAATVIKAMGSGKRAAERINENLNKLKEDARSIKMDMRLVQKKGFTIQKKKTLVIDKERNSSIKQIEVYAPFIADSAKAGQFVLIMLREKGERIPLTLADWDKEKGTITLVFQEVGKTTGELGIMKEGEELFSILGPLGTPEPLEKLLEGKAVALVFGGVGTAPMHPILRSLFRMGNKNISIMGARNKDLLFWEDEMKALSHEFYTTFDNEQRYVTTQLKELLEDKQKRDEIDHVIAIGPPRMMQAVYELAKEYGKKTYVSLNPNMLDGTGMCGNCKILTSGGEGKIACLDGRGGINAGEVNWDVFITRTRQYVEEEKKVMDEWIKQREDKTKKTLKGTSELPVIEKEKQSVDRSEFENLIGLIEQAI